MLVLGWFEASTCSEHLLWLLHVALPLKVSEADASEGLRSKATAAPFPVSPKPFVQGKPYLKILNLNVKPLATLRRKRKTSNVNPQT